jgi:hypothetical protein
MSDTDITPGEVAEIVDSADGVRTYAPSLHVVLTMIGPLVEAIEENVPQVWAESVDLRRRSEKATVMRVLGLVASSLGSLLTEVEVGDLPGDGNASLEAAITACNEAGDQLGEVAEQLLVLQRSGSDA